MIVERPALERRVLASLEAGAHSCRARRLRHGRTSLLLRLARAHRRRSRPVPRLRGGATTPERCLAAIAPRRRALVARPPPSRAGVAARGVRRAARASSTTPRAADGGPVDVPARRVPRAPHVRELSRACATCSASSSRGSPRARRASCSRRASPRARIGCSATRRRASRSSTCRRSTRTKSQRARAALRRRRAATGRADVAPAVAALAGGRAGLRRRSLLEALGVDGPGDRSGRALAALFAPDGRLTARCRESYEFRLHRARGYGALKAILGDPRRRRAAEPHRDRAPPAPHAGLDEGLLSWLEDVDLVDVAAASATRIDDPLLRLYVRLYGRPVPPTDDESCARCARTRKARLAASRATPRRRRRRCPRPTRRHHRDRSTARSRDRAIIEIDCRTSSGLEFAAPDARPGLRRLRAPALRAPPAARRLSSIGPSARPDAVAADEHFDVEPLAVIGAFGRREAVVRQAAAVGLQPFLQRGLPVLGERRLGGLIAARRR